MAVALIDLPFSFAVDTLLLPYDLSPMPDKVCRPSGAHFLSFVRLKGDYAKDNSQVFYCSGVIEGADAKSFVVLSTDGVWARDDHRAYRYGSALEGADGISFVLLSTNGIWARDNHRAYYDGRALEGADAKSFVVLSTNGSWARDDHKAYFYGRALEVEDVSTFCSVAGDWAKDSRAYYYYAFSPPDNIRGGKVECDYPTLQVLGGYYAKDKNRAYYCGKPINDVDVASFRVVDELHAVDKYSRYSESIIDRGERSERADRATFVSLKGGYSKDKTNVFCWQFIIEGADPKSFVVLSRDGWARDQREAYRWWRSLGVEDISTFSLVKGEWAKDSRAYYATFPDGKFWGKVDCDYSTLEILDGYYAKDKNRAYYRGKPINDVDVASFRVIDHEHAEDKFATYSESLRGPKTQTE
jgi:hypothetical protein